ncbi:MAG: kinase-like domain-containing protein [Monoraphidium minutum]|nr:MAG: kinase-like domain-containing protein [Monoraphidium minutum]
MGFLDRILKPSKAAAADAVAKAGAASRHKPAAATAIVRPVSADDDPDSDDSDGDIFGLPNQARGASAPLMAPLFAPRRGALDMGGDSLSDGGMGAGRASEAGGRLGGAPLGGSELDALFSDVALIHRGGHAMIYRARERRSRRRVVLKAYLRQQRNPVRAAALEREQEMLRLAAPHPHVVGLERVLENLDATYLVLGASSGGTLIEAIANSGGRLPEHVAARRVAAPLLRALAHLHGRGIVHRDLKPEHILVTQDGLRVADFSTAARLPNAPDAPPPVQLDMQRRTKELRRSIEARHRRSLAEQPPAEAGTLERLQEHPEEAEIKPAGCAAGQGEGAAAAAACSLPRDVLNHRVGSLEYMAPEMLAKPTAAEVFHLVLSHGMDEEELPTYDEKVDVWATGALMFEALTGCQPFLADGAAEMAAMVAARLAAADPGSGLPAFIASAPGLSADARAFLARCMQQDPAARPSAAELLAHPWIARRASMAAEAGADGGDVAGPECFTRTMSDATLDATPVALSDPGSASGASARLPLARCGVWVHVPPPPVVFVQLAVPVCFAIVMRALVSPGSGVSTPPRVAPCWPQRGALDLGGGAAAAARGGAGAAELDATFGDVVLLHRGRNALVYRAREQGGGRRVVIKAFCAARGGALAREVRALRAAAPHPGVVGLEGVEAGGSGGGHLVLEACSGGTLIEAIANSGGRLPEHVAARRVAAPLLRALAHLHGRGIVHRDLKPEHILVTQDGLRVADFSTAAFTAPAGRGQGAAPPGEAPARERLNARPAGAALEYAAPELLARPTEGEVFRLVLSHGMDEEELPTYDEKVDVWATGALMFEALTGCQPFLADGAAEMAAVVAARLAAADPGSGLPAFIASAPGLSADARAFLARCMQQDPAARPSAAELLAHPWIARRASISILVTAGGDGAMCHPHLRRTAAAVPAPGLVLGRVAGGCAPHCSASCPDAGGAPAARAGEAAGLAGTADADAACGMVAPVAALQRCSSAGDEAALPHAALRSYSGRLQGSRPGTRAAAAAALAATALTPGARIWDEPGRVTGMPRHYSSVFTAGPISCLAGGGSSPHLLAPGPLALNPASRCKPGAARPLPAHGPAPPAAPRTARDTAGKARDHETNPGLEKQRWCAC